MDRRSFLAASAAFLAGCGGGGGGGSPPRSGPSPGSAPPPQILREPLGLVTHDLQRQTVEEIRALNVRQVRFTVYWHLWGEPFYRHEIEKQLAWATGLDLLLVLHGGGESLEDFGRFVGQVHAMVPSVPLQLWNEVDHPDGPGNGWRFFEGNPGKYTAHLRDIRNAYPALRLIGPGLASTGDGLAAWVRALNISPVEAIALHTYGYPLVLSYREKYEVASRLTEKPIWNTETGLEKSVVIEERKPRWEMEQAENLEACAELGVYDRTYIYCLRDEKPDGHSLTPPAASWLQKWNG